MFCITMLFISTPMVVQQTKIVKFKALNGVFQKVSKPKLTYANYKNMSYQVNIEKYISQNFGFREPVLRCYNQLVWDLFDKTCTDRIYVGKDNWLYEPWYVDEYFGTLEYFDDTVALRKEFDRQIGYIYQISEALKANETELIVMMVPGKPHIYPEYLQESDKNPDSVGIRANDYYTEKFSELGVNHINFTDWFLKTKEADSFMVFPKTGTHWSNMAAVYITDSLIKYIEATSGMNMHNLSIGNLHPGKIREPDNDLEKILNLVRPINRDLMQYADFSVAKDSLAYKPNLLVIGDSYFWNIANQIPLDNIFSRYPYWYYNNTIYFDPEHNNIKQVDLVEELIQSDVVLLLFSAYPMYYFSCGFSHVALTELYFSPDMIDSLVNDRIMSINSHPEQVEMIKGKAQKKNISLEQAIYDDAKYLIYNNPERTFKELADRKVPTTYSSKVYEYYNMYKNPTSKKYIRKADKYGEVSEPTMEDKIAKVIENMKSNPEWMNNLQEKANKTGKSLDEIMYRDAKWMVSEEGNKSK